VFPQNPYLYLRQPASKWREREEGGIEKGRRREGERQGEEREGEGKGFAGPM